MMKPLRSVPLVALIAASTAFGFSGSGRESLMEADKYLSGRRASPEEAARIAQMTPAEKYSKAVELLIEAERNVSTEQETQNVASMLAGAYNQLGLDSTNTKDYKNAVYYFQEAVKRSDKNAVLQMNLGEVQFAAGDYADAASSLARAKEISSDPAIKERVSRGLIMTYEAQGRSNDSRGYDDAIREIEGQLAERPDDAGLLFLLGRNYQAKGDVQKAVEVWERARKQGSVPEPLEHEYQKAKSALAIKTEKQFAQESSSHFTIEFDEKAKSMSGLAKKFLDWLEEAYDDVGSKFDVRPTQKIFVTIYADKDYVEAVKVGWSDGVHQENRVTIRVHPNATEARYRYVIFHEWTHHVVSVKAGQKHVPTWINEGFAMLSTKSDSPVADLGFMERVIQKKGKYIPFKAIDPTFMNLPSEKHVKLAYAQSLSITTKLIERFGWGPLMKILIQVGAGQDFYETFKMETRVDFADYEKQWFEELKGSHAEPVAEAGPGFDGLQNGAPNAPASAPAPAAGGR